MSDDEVTINVKGLEQILKALKTTRPPIARVGILGDSTRKSATDKTMTNADVGAIHEFGTDKMPVRSFLRLPISAMLEKRMVSSGAFSKDALAQIIKDGSLRPYVEKMAVLAEGIVAEAFDTGGFGTWAPVDMRRKKNHQILVETQQLRNSITSEVK